MAHEQHVSIVARHSYLWALAEHWPEVLKGLEKQVFPHYKPTWADSEVGLPPVPVFESWQNVEAGADRRELVAALRRWGNEFSITEHWIFDVALDTLMVYYQVVHCQGKKPPDRWRWYILKQGFQPTFAPQFSLDGSYGGSWDESWALFRRRIEFELRVQLSEYKRRVDLIFAVRRKEHLDRDARWTALYQKGEDAISISETSELEGNDPEQTIFRAINRFAKLIGLNLRRRGHRRRRAIVQG